MASKVRILWYGLGDRNTKFFHSRASQRRKKNSISDIWDEYGNWCDTNESIAAARGVQPNPKPDQSEQPA